MPTTTQFAARWPVKKFGGKRIGYPKIGAGRAGSDWETFAGIIKEELAGEDQTLFEFAQ